MTVYEYNTYKLMALYTLFHMSWHGDDDDDDDDDGDIMMMIIMIESVEQCPGWMELWKLKQVRMPWPKCAIQKMCTPEWFFLEPVIVFGIVCAGNVEACKAWTEHCKLHSPKRH